jgi:hypothetical protein
MNKHHGSGFDKSLSYFSTALGREILYRKPLFIIPYELKKPALGGNEIKTPTDYKTLTASNDLWVRFMLAIHSRYQSATNVLRDIYNTEDIASVIKKAKEKSFDPILVDYFAQVSDEDIDEAAKGLYNSTKDNNTIVICESDASKDSHKFLQMYAGLIGISAHYKSHDQVTTAMKKAGFKQVVTEYIDDLQTNPLYTYKDTYELIKV